LTASPGGVIVRTMNAVIQARVNELPPNFVGMLKNSFPGQSIVVLPEAEYLEMARARRNAEYLARLDRAMRDIDEGRGIVKTMDELEAMADE